MQYNTRQRHIVSCLPMWCAFAVRCYNVLPIALDCTALHCIALHTDTELHCTALHTAFFLHSFRFVLFRFVYCVAVTYPCHAIYYSIVSLLFTYPLPARISAPFEEKDRLAVLDAEADWTTMRRLAAEDEVAAILLAATAKYAIFFAVVLCCVALCCNVLRCNALRCVLCLFCLFRLLFRCCCLSS